MVGCRSDRNLNPSSQTFAQGSYGSLIVMLWLGVCLNYNSLRFKIIVAALVQFCTRASTKLRQLFWNGGSTLYLRMLARCVIIRVHLSQSRMCTSIDPPTDTYQHDTYYLAAYGESDLTISPVFSRERFSFYKFSSQAYPCERIGKLATLFTLPVFYFFVA